ncbi:MAG TPA: hypothetical protein VF860_15710 [Candidatus Acidoferrales bacterium]
MPEPSSAFSSFVKWIGGILAAVITGLVLFVGQQYLTNHKWPWTKGQTTQTTKAAKIIPVDGRVVDSTRTKLIDNALVRMQVSSNHEEQQTDSEGRYAFSFDGFDPEFSASMSIDAPGYKQLRLNLPLSKLRQMKEQRLEPETPPPHPVGGGAAPGPVIGCIAGGGKGAIIGAAAGAGKSIPANYTYIMRADLKRILAHP